MKLRTVLLWLALWLGAAAPAFAVNPQTTVGDAAYTVLSTDQTILTTTAFTASRTWTLPSAGATCVGANCSPIAMQLQIVDRAAALTGTNTLVIAPASGETINGNAANLILSAAGVRVLLIPTSGTNWQAYVFGDYRVTTVAVASVVALTTTAAKTIATISLSQGTWDCTGVIHRNLAAATSVTVLKTSISATTDTSGTLDLATMVQFSTAANVMALNTSQVIGPIRLSLAATTSYFLVAQDTFTVDTNGGYGQLRCIRV